MATYIVKVPATISLIFHVKANSEEEAKQIVAREEGDFQKVSLSEDWISNSGNWTVESHYENNQEK